MEEKTNKPAQKEMPKSKVGKVPKSKTAFIVGGIVLGILAIAGIVFLWWWFVQPAFVIDGHKYSKSTYFGMMASASKSGVKRSDATNQYIDIEKKRIAAGKMNLKPTANQLSVSRANSYPQTNGQNLSTWQEEVSYGNSITPVLQFTRLGGYSGAYFVFPFAIHQDPLPYQYVSGQIKTPTGWRDPKVVAEDKAYALQVAQKDHERIKNGTPSQVVIAEIRNDPRLARLGSSNGSMIFTINQQGIYHLSNGISQDLSNKFDQKILQKENTVSLTDIMTGKMFLQDLPNRPVVDAYYYFVQIDNYQGANLNIDSEFSATVNGLTVQRNV